MRRADVIGANLMRPGRVLRRSKTPFESPMAQRHAHGAIGRPHSETAKAFGRIVRTLLEHEFRLAELIPCLQTMVVSMKIAIPVTKGVLASHFGHCEQFVLFEVGPDGKTVGDRQVVTPPPHEPGTFPSGCTSRGLRSSSPGGWGPARKACSVKTVYR